MKLCAIVIAALALWIFLCLADLALAARVEGTVLDKSGQAVDLATVSVPMHRKGTITDERGHFQLDLPGGPAVLVFSRMGFEPARVSVTVQEGLAALSVRLKNAPVPLSEVTVTTSSFGRTGKSEGAVVRRSDVYMTPGGAADIFQSLRALPGINAPAEGAAIYVRGGDPRETLIRLDGGDIGHPYHYEGASGGLFTALDTYMLKSAFFSSGGFSARYGGALSGVLDIQSQDDLGTRTVSVGANITGGEMSGSWALVPGKLALVSSLRFSQPELLFKLYGSPHEYETSPSSRDAAAKLLYKYSDTGRLALTYLGTGDGLTVHSNYLNYQGLYHDRARSHYGALQMKDLLGDKFAVSGEASFQYFQDDWTFGPVGAGRTERNVQAGVDAVWEPGSRHEVSAGATYRRPDQEITGTFPSDSTDYQPGAPTREYDTRVRVSYPGFYLEDKLRVLGPIYATLGARWDYASRPSGWTADPRAALAWRLDERQTLRVAAGRYHQLPDPKYQDPVYGNPGLAPLAADHVIAGYEFKSEHTNLRLEAYHKTYRNLVTTNSTLYYASTGHGFARGVDFFLQGTRDFVTGWISYGYLDTRRKELDAPTEVPASYGVKHEVTLVGECQMSQAWQVGVKYNFASGRPYTPVASAVYDEARGIWKPVYAYKNSGLLPDYHRLDLRVTRLFQMGSSFGLPASSVCAFYVEALNMLGRRNVLDYYYNQDYTQQFKNESYFSRRFLVGGVSLTW